MNWITLTEAANQPNINLTKTELQQYLTPQNDTLTIEERFATLGLLFDQKRYDAGESAFLQVISQPPSEEEDEPYDLDQCTLRIVLTILPPKDPHSPRQVIVAASTHSDLPVAQIVPFSELEPLPEPITQIISQLEADLPNRRYRAQIKQTKPKQKTLPQPTPSQPKSQQPHTVQINLFGS